MSAVPDSTPAFTEDAVSQIPALHVLQQLGWTLLTPAEALTLRGGRRSEVLLRPILERQLVAINRFQYRGVEHAFDRSAIEEGVRALSNLGDDGLVRTNEKVWTLLRFGKAIPQTVDGDTKSYTLQFVDWERPERNVYHVSDEFSVESFGATDSRRPDVVLFVNGIPFAVIECKRSGQVGGSDPLEQAISQQLRNQQEAEIPRLFHFAQVLLGLAVNQAKYAATGTPLAFWQAWREPAAADEALTELVNRPLSEGHMAQTFAPDPARFKGATSATARAWWLRVVEAGRTPTDQDRLLYAIARPERLLALASRYTVFDGGVRKLARYQQYFAVEEILARVREVDADGQRRGGLVWHTQGSGKSLTMVMLAEALLKAFAPQSPKIVLVTDRVDLDEQIYGTFVSSGVSTEQAATGRHLLDLLTSPRTVVVTTLLQKFEAAVNAKDVAFDNPNIFVLVDEGHRSHTGQFHTALRRVLPRACLIGFTGTPVFRSQLPTIERFGGLIGAAYTIGQAVEDKAVVPLRYEGRYVPQKVDQAAIDEWFKRYTLGLSEAQRADLKRKFSSADQLNQTEQKIRAVAWDIAEHFRENFKGTGFKGQLVTPSKATALLYQRYLDEFNAATQSSITSEVLISPPDTREGNKDVDGGDDRGKQAVKAFWERMIARYGNESRYQKDLTTRFKSAEDPDLIIVVDKLLTGFDAPRNSVLYLTRSLKDHTLLQAIARVNRVCEGKDAGLIVDYYGILEHLSEALEQYSDAAQDYAAHLQEVMTPLADAVKELPQRHSDVWEVFRAVRTKDDQEAMERHLAAEADRQQFYERLTAFTKVLRLAFASVEFHERTPSEQIVRYRRDLKYFMQLRASIARRYAEVVDFKQYQEPIRKLLDTYVGAGQVEVLVKPVSIHDREQFAQEVEAVQDPEGRAEVIANRVRRTIHEHLDEDPVFYQQFSELIDKTLAALHEQRMSQLDALKELEDIRDRVRDRRAYEEVPEVLRHRDVAKSYYDLLRDELKAAKVELDDIAAADLAARIDDLILARRKVDWVNDIDVQNQMKTAIEDELFELQQRRSIMIEFKLIDRLLDRLIDVARRRVP
ncbi:MAG: type I restriction endonuclease subunit R [Dehalococcoidia bacterium]